MSCSFSSAMSKASEAKSVFQALDTNGDGELDPQELQCRLSDFGVEVGTLLAAACPGRAGCYSRSFQPADQSPLCSPRTSTSSCCSTSWTRTTTM